MSWNVGLFEHRLNSVFLNGTSFFNPKEWKQNNIRSKRKEKILRRKLKLVKSLLFYPKGFITSAQSLLTTGLQQSHQITNVACRTIDPNNQCRVSRKCYKHRSGRTVCGNTCSGIFQRFFFYLWNGNSSQSRRRATRINAEWSLAELPVSKETVLLRRQRNERER